MTGSEQCRRSGRLVLPAAGWSSAAFLFALMKCRDDDGNYQLRQFVIHRVLDAPVIIAKQRPFHCLHSSGGHVGGRYRKRVACLLVPVCGLPHQMCLSI